MGQELTGEEGSYLQAVKWLVIGGYPYRDGRWPTYCPVKDWRSVQDHLEYLATPNRKFLEVRRRTCKNRK